MRSLQTPAAPAMVVPLMHPAKPLKVRRRQFQLPCPAMNNSERARFYRVENKRLALELTTTVASLRDHVHRLQLGATVSRALVRCGVSRSVRDRVAIQLKPFIEDPSHHLVFPAFNVQKMELESADGYGTDQAPIVQITSALTGKYPPSSLEAIYPFFPGNSVLLDTLMHTVVEYRCVVRFYFSAEGVFVTAEVEVDWINGLVGCIGGLAEVAMVAEPLRDLGDPFVIKSTRPMR